MPLNTPDPTHRCLHERYGTAAREASELRELVNSGKMAGCLAASPAHRTTPILKSRLPHPYAASLGPVHLLRMTLRTIPGRVCLVQKAQLGVMQP